MQHAAQEKVSILLVDDVADNLSMLEAILDRPDYCLVTAVSGEEAVDQAHQRDFAVIMLDVMMPGMSGFEVAKAIRQSDRNASTPIIFITAYAREKPSIAKGFALGAADYLTKPIDVLQVRAKVDVFVEIFKTNRLLRERHSEHFDHVFDNSFLDYVTQELRGPLASMLGFTRLLKDRRLSDGERDLFIDIIDRNGHEVARVIDDLSDLARAESGQLQVREEAFPFMDLLHEIRCSWGAAAEKNQVRVMIEARGRLPDHIVSDKERLRQILDRIMGNAIKFTREGCVYVTVRFLPADKERLKPQIAFMIRDTGRGMTPEQVKLIFRPNAPGDTHNRYGLAGRGLGLLLARQLARLLGGDVVLKESTVGVGSSFAVTVDTGAVVLEEPKIHSSRASAHSRGPLPPRILEGTRILVVDDVEDNCHLMMRLLEIRGASVATAFNGKEAVDKALSDKFDVILMDIQMPVMDGYQATRELRSRGYVKPIIAFTAHALKDDRDRSLREGCDEHLVKPFDQDKFLATIRKFSQNQPH